jgi:phospholipid/cholesterol/gamma-HCH transport system ATP-binding protein
VPRGGSRCEVFPTRIENSHKRRSVRSRSAFFSAFIRGTNIALTKVMNAHTDPQPAIEFRHVNLSFDDRRVLTDISFILPRGEMILLTGISGSGKSVLLRLAMGLLKPDSGQILIDGKQIQDMDESELLAVRGGLMGMVFQEDSLFTGISVFDNAAYRLEEHGWSEESIERSVAEVLQFVGLEGEEEKFPEELSGGMKRRLEIARALIGWPSIMLFDEPTMSLDPLAALKVMDLVIRARDVNHISSLYATKKIHEFEYLAATNTKVIVLKDGAIVFSGSVEEFQKSEHPAIKELAPLDPHDHSKDPHFTDPWDKHRRPKETIL